jgi:glycosyltransferase involved in cell wall biosynthesis
VDARRIRVIHSGYDRDRYRPEKAPEDARLRERLGPEPYFVTVGTIQPRKNYERLIRAFVRFRRETRSNYRLIIVGGAGWLSEPTVALAKKYAGDGVVLWGRAEPQELPPLLRGAAAFVFPALYEGFGIPLVEAMACGAPTIASNTGPVPEIAGDAALLVDPSSEEQLYIAMKQIIIPEWAARLAEKSLERAQVFSWAKAGRAYIDVARALCRR